MARLATLELFRERMGFSAGHFTIFSATEREHLHGHNYQLHVLLTTEVEETYGLTFDYRRYKDTLYARCKSLNETFILPKYSPYLTLKTEGEYVIAIFDNKKISFLKTDVTVLPIRNATVEELSLWFLQPMIEDEEDLESNKIVRLEVKVSSSPGQYGSTAWESKHGIISR